MGTSRRQDRGLVLGGWAGPGQYGPSRVRPGDSATRVLRCWSRAGTWRNCGASAAEIAVTRRHATITNEADLEALAKDGFGKKKWAASPFAVNANRLRVCPTRRTLRPRARGSPKDDGPAVSSARISFFQSVID